MRNTTFDSNLRDDISVGVCQLIGKERGNSLGVCSSSTVTTEVEFAFLCLLSRTLDGEKKRSNGTECLHTDAVHEEEITVWNSRLTQSKLHPNGAQTSKPKGR